MPICAKRAILPGSRNSRSKCFLITCGSSSNFLRRLAWIPIRRSKSWLGRWSLRDCRLSAVQNTAMPTSEEVVTVALGQFSPESAEAYFKAQKRVVVKVRDYSLYAFGRGSGDGGLFFCFMDSNTAVLGRRKELEELIAVQLWRGTKSSQQHGNCAAHLTGKRRQRDLGRPERALRAPGNAATRATGCGIPTVPTALLQTARTHA